MKKDTENIHSNINNLNVKNIVGKIDENILSDVKKDTENINSNIIINVRIFDNYFL